MPSIARRNRFPRELGYESAHLGTRNKDPCLGGRFLKQSITREHKRHAGAGVIVPANGATPELPFSSMDRARGKCSGEKVRGNP